jgi:hypothetical protein
MTPGAVSWQQRARGEAPGRVVWRQRIGGDRSAAPKSVCGEAPKGWAPRLMGKPAAEITHAGNYTS